MTNFPCDTNNIQFINCCQVMSCLSIFSDNNSITITPAGDCGIDLTFSGNNLDNILKFGSGGCLNFSKDFSNGVITYTPIFDQSCITFPDPPAPSVYTVNNGLSESPSHNFQFGGFLIKSTFLDLNTFNLSMRDGPTNTGIVLTPGIREVDVHGKLVADYTTWIQNNTTIGPNDGTMVFGSLTAAPRLLVNKDLLWATSPVECGSYMDCTMLTPGIGNTEIYASVFENLNWGMTADQIVNPKWAISAGVSHLQYTSPFRTTGGNLSAHTAEVYFIGSGSIDRIISYRAISPIQAAETFTGTIDEAVGIQIEGQRAFLPTQVLSSYGIKQLSADDRNMFTGTFQLPSANTSIGIATLVSGTVTINTPSAKVGSRIFISRNTPSGTLGDLSSPDVSIVDGVSFTINSSNAAETSTINWWILNS